MVMAAITSPALAKGGWQVCIYAPGGTSSEGKINFQSKHCYIFPDGEEVCDKTWQSQENFYQEGYVNSKSLQDFWEDAYYMDNSRLRSSTGFYLIKFDRSFAPGYQEQIMRTRTLPFRIMESQPRSACNRYDTTYQFAIEGKEIKFYNGCPQATSACADKWK